MYIKWQNRHYCTPRAATATFIVGTYLVTYGTALYNAYKSKSHYTEVTLYNFKWLLTSSHIATTLKVNITKTKSKLFLTSPWFYESSRRHFSCNFLFINFYNSLFFLLLKFPLNDLLSINNVDKNNKLKIVTF